MKRYIIYQQSLPDEKFGMQRKVDRPGDPVRYRLFSQCRECDRKRLQQRREQDMVNKYSQRRTISRAQELAIAKAMEPVIKRVTDKVIAYHDGWSDARVLEATGLAKDGIIEDQVSRYRTSVFGKLNIATENNPMRNAFNRIEALEARVAQLEEAMTKPRDNAKHSTLTGLGAAKEWMPNRQ